MPFSEKIKLEVKQKAAFTCCRCHNIFPESEGGTDYIDNAAPLCQNCHDRFGANPEKCKEIKQMRDWWYEVVKEKYGDEQERFKEINELFLQIQAGHTGKLQHLKSLLETGFATLLEEIKRSKINQSPNEIQRRASEFVSAARLADRVRTNVWCKKCGTRIGLLIGSNQCPNCREPL
ncbi:MAG TPA: hypothetical protein VI387_01100 [Candidatus Brocadiales bacterium]|nr:hypothetical protein [Candidatus Brocadiales bacterium]